MLGLVGLVILGKGTIIIISLQRVSREHELCARSYLLRRRPLLGGDIPIQVQAMMLPAGSLVSGKLVVAGSKVWRYLIH